jgi:hypothetical protein
MMAVPGPRRRPVATGATVQAGSTVDAGRGVVSPPARFRRLGTPTFTDEPETTHLKLGRPYLRIAVVVAFAFGVLGVGYLGPHSPGRAESTLAAATASAGVSPAASVPGPQPTGRAVPTADPRTPAEQLADLTGLSRLAAVPSETSSDLRLPIANPSPAIAGGTLYYIVGGDQILASVLGSGSTPAVLVSVPHCQAITEVAAGGGHLAYVVAFANIPAATQGGCDGFGQVAWSLRIMDLATGRSTTVASGVRRESGVLTIGIPIHVAVTDTAYAFDRPDATTDEGGGETVEVHSFDGALLWATKTADPVTDVLLAGDKLAVVTQSVRPSVGARTLWLASSAQRQLGEIAQPTSSASLSADGHYLAWDADPQIGLSGQSRVADVGIANTVTGAVGYLETPTSGSLTGGSDPQVFETSRGVLVTWLTTAPDGSVYPAFTWLLGGWGFIETDQRPLWVVAQGGTLIWLTESADGQTARAFEAALDDL